MEFKVVFDFRKLERDIKKASGEEAEKAIKGLKKSELQEIGDGVIDEMKSVIAKGLSPIKGKGRFPEYIGVTKIRKVSKVAKSLSGGRKKTAKKKASDLKKKAYPYSVQDEFPGKKPRPVNMFLSGEFLKNLIAKVTGKKLEVGFFEEPWESYEQGHREGANGQAKRPIIPTGDGEQFSDTIYRRLVKVVQSVFDSKK
jgi:hypothetical protein